MATRAKGVNAAHTAGIFADMTLDGPEIGTLVAVVDRAKNLPNRRTMGKQDPYCAMRLGKEAKKTDTDKRGGQTPRWDQELRFTVHDSPDYYKLKCSIFNDDKKTDLIGESWLDLQDVIVPGGGQSDRWRQLNFKGKYAGDIRIELTYYDTRPKPEPPVEAKRPRDKAYSTAGESTATVSGSRQLGPREIKRRPLPPGPGGYPSSHSAALSPDYWQDEEQDEAFAKQGYTNSNPPPRPPKQKFVPETPDDVGYDLNPRFGPDSYEPQYNNSHPRHQKYPSNDFYNDYDPSVESFQEPNRYTEDPFQGRPFPVQPASSQFVRGPPPAEQQFQPAANSPHSLPDHHSYHSSPPSRTTPQATPPAGMANPQWTSRTSTSPVKYAAYKDSPLRQSVSQMDIFQSTTGYPEQDLPFGGDEPPPPPAHRGQVARIAVPPTGQGVSGEQIQPEFSAVAASRDSYGQQVPQTPVKYQTVENRSPLQRLEQEYDSFNATPPTKQRPQRQISPADEFDTCPKFDDSPYPLFVSERRKSNTCDIYQPRPGSSRKDTSPSDQPYSQPLTVQHYHESPRDDFRHSTGHAPPRRAQTFDNFDLQDERHVRRSDPVIVRPRAISPNPYHNIPRKSITPTPTTPDDPKDVGASPYGPDSYDVLNPGTSPAADSDAHKSSGNALEAARQKEVEKLRDQGPIIGNDGRVIDPSDHLPADTWAPEPERKQRKPEHVIRIRTREEARMHRNAGSSPASARPHSIAVSPYQSSPHAPVSSPHPSSPAPAALPASPSAESPAGRNRLRKPMPQRPLPTQPYATHPESAPIVPTLPSLDARPSPTSQRYSVHSSPAGTLPLRAPLGEYAMPSTNNYSPRGGSGSAALDYRQDYMHQSPTKVPLGRQQPHPHPPPDALEYGGGSPYGGDNSLALELSRIDIGPSRMGRTTLRPQKAYGMY